jgi:hypothetical protein
MTFGEMTWLLLGAAIGATAACAIPYAASVIARLLRKPAPPVGHGPSLFDSALLRSRSRREERSPTEKGGNRVMTEVMLVIDPAALSGNQTATTVASRLLELGEPMVNWTPELNGAPAKAKFRLQNQARSDKFLADALAIDGVSLAASARGASENVSSDA